MTNDLLQINGDYYPAKFTLKVNGRNFYWGRPDNQPYGLYPPEYYSLYGSVADGVITSKSVESQEWEMNGIIGATSIKGDINQFIYNDHLFYFQTITPYFEDELLCLKFTATARTR